MAAQQTGMPPELTVRQRIAATLRRRRSGSGFWFGLAIAVIWPFVLWGTRLGWRGGEHLPRTGGALLVGNHVSFSDPIFDIAFATTHGRIPRFMAKSELWGVPVVRWVLGGGGHVPVYRASKRAAESFTGAIDALERGEIVAVYPEGTYTADPDGWPMRPKNGVARIALRSGAPVIPLANWGTQDVLPAEGKPRLFPRRRVGIVLGPPVDLSEFAGKPLTRTTLDAATKKIMDAVTGLLEEMRGEARPAVPFDPEAPALGSESPGSPGGRVAGTGDGLAERPAS
ncbi:lysophospholipid acyltransferase family protein [Pseudonocardia nematodicida]|uniref:Lysophospholipid acyltransferase family protein n=1 Tax=Pseudonocardia nematodicida TaxID=1206997 RepID=A0ABV1KKA4_9PSEU